MLLSALILTIYTYRHKKLRLLKDLGASFVVLVGAFLLLSLILFLLFWSLASISAYINPGIMIQNVLIIEGDMGPSPHGHSFGMELLYCLKDFGGHGEVDGKGIIL